MPKSKLAQVSIVATYSRGEPFSFSSLYLSFSSILARSHPRSPAGRGTATRIDSWSTKDHGQSPTFVDHTSPQLIRGRKIGLKASPQKAAG